MSEKESEVFLTDFLRYYDTILDLISFQSQQTVLAAFNLPLRQKKISKSLLVCMTNKQHALEVRKHLDYVVAFWEVVQKRGEKVENEIAQRLLHDTNLHQLFLNLTSDSLGKRLFTGLKLYLGPYLIVIALVFAAYKLYV